MLANCVVWEGGLGYVVLTFRRGLGKFWRKVCMCWWAFAWAIYSMEVRRGYVVV